ncbi:MAG: hypothetical protein HQ518_06400 [Rhodopirellula sp.]|nr:hypothetical protein [Rhodopirellula sp.]
MRNSPESQRNAERLHDSLYVTATGGVDVRSLDGELEAIEPLSLLLELESLDLLDESLACLSASEASL